MSLIDQINWQKVNGLLPVIVQDAKTNEVLMFAYMNKKALELSLKTKKAHYFSRTKNRLWLKGESSSNFQIIKEIYLDCDNDTLLLKVEQIGVACHTGAKSCFFQKIDLENENITEEIKEKENINYSFMDELYHYLLKRKNDDPTKSYTAKLIKSGENSYLKKIAEEAAEFCFAIKDNDKDQIVYECADLVYHSLIPLVAKDIHPEQIINELKRRFKTSGIEEKKSRKK